MPYRKTNKATRFPKQYSSSQPAQGITVPYRFTPREYQMRLLRAMDGGASRAVCVWHRRSGKDKTGINIMAKAMFRKVGAYYYFFPTYAQGRKILWEGMDRDGMPFLDHFPPQLVKNKNQVEMKLELANGSIMRVVGTDNINRVVGTNPIGCIFSEYSLQDPEAWEYIRPILAENGGWALFLFTPRGRNHGYRILETAKANNWFWQVLAWDDTRAIPKDIIAQEEKEMPQDLFEQEYSCKFVEGASSFFKGVDEIIYDGEEMQPDPQHYYQVGVDLARYQDYTVITPFDLQTFKVGKPERFNQMDWEFQRSQVETAYLRWNKAKVVLDNTAIGQPMGEALKNRGINVEEVRISTEERRNLLYNLRLLIAEKKIRIPRDEQLVKELKDVQFSLNDAGTVEISVPSKHTDDMVFSLALAVRNVGQPVTQDEHSPVPEEFPLYAPQNYE